MNNAVIVIIVIAIYYLGLIVCTLYFLNRNTKVKSIFVFLSVISSFLFGKLLYLIFDVDLLNLTICTMTRDYSEHNLRLILTILALVLSAVLTFKTIFDIYKKRRISFVMFLGTLIALIAFGFFGLREFGWKPLPLCSDIGLY